MSTIGKHANEPPPPIPGLSDPLAKILDRALAKKADDRFQTPIDLANEFNAIIEERAESTTFMVVKPKTDPVITKVRVRTKSRMKWIPRLLGVITFILLGALILLKSFPIPNQPSESKTPTQTSPSSTTEIPSLIPLPLGPTGVLHFQDGTALINQATIAALAMPIPPRGSHYEVWLVNEGQRRSLGILMLDANGRGELTNQDETGNNLLSLYDRVEITIEPDTDTDPGSSGLLAYSFTLPPDGLIHVRHLLVSFPDAPNGTALIQGLNTDVNLISQTAREMQTAFLKGDEIATRQNAEAIFNILVGDQNQSYKDWNADGQTADPGDGFGLLLNGTNPGYIQSVYSHADYAVISPGATQNMIIHGEEVKTCAQNLAQWASQLRDRVLTILTSTSGSDLSQPIQDSVILADRLLTGVDLDGDKIIEPILGECGEITTYEHAYSMADMPLLPVSLPGTSTAISNTTTPGNGIIVQPTRTRERVGKTPTASPTPGPPTKKPTNTPKTPKKKN